MYPIDKSVKLSVIEERGDQSPEDAIRFLRGFDWNENRRAVKFPDRRPEVKLRFCLDCGYSLTVWADSLAEDRFCIVLDRPEEKTFFGMSFIPERTISKMESISMDKVEEILRVLFGGDAQEMDRWVDTNAFAPAGA